MLLFKLYKDVYYTYVIVDTNKKSREFIIDIGVTINSWKRFTHHKIDHKYKDNIKMIIVMECSEQNRPSLIRTSHQFGRVVEYMLFSFGPDFSLRNRPKSGDGNNSDPNIAILLQAMPDLKTELNQFLDEALEKNKVGEQKAVMQLQALTCSLTSNAHEVKQNL